MGTRETVETFIRAINSGDVDSVFACMAEEHVFIDSLGKRVAGRQTMAAGWRAYLAMFPDYRICVQTLMVEGEEALLCGQTHGTLHRDGASVEGGEVTLQAAWRTVVTLDKIAVWQVYADNKLIYDLLVRES